MSSSVSPLKEILLATAPMLAPRSSLASSRRGLGSGVMVKEAAIWVEEGAGAGAGAGEGAGERGGVMVMASCWPPGWRTRGPLSRTVL